MNSSLSLQEQYAQKSICFGCGPSNANGLKIRSFLDPKDPKKILCEWEPKAHHQAFPGVINGGILGTLLDCHSNWSACIFLMKKNGLSAPPCTVTADFHVKLLRPTPLEIIRLEATALELKDDRAVIEAKAFSPSGKVTATCVGTFVAVNEGHPAFHRW